MTSNAIPEATGEPIKYDMCKGIIEHGAAYYACAQYIKNAFSAYRPQCGEDIEIAKDFVSDRINYKTHCDCNMFDNMSIVTPKEVLAKRGVRRLNYDADTAIICFRGSKASEQLKERFNGRPLKETILYHPQLCYSSEFRVLIVPEMMWGGPVTAIVIEELFALGVKTLIGFGAGGSINPEVLPGSMFIARKAVSCDGTSREYSDEGECMPDPQLLDYYLNRREKLGFLFLNGLTTDSLYRETPEKIEYWRRLGADFINLEVSPFYTVSNVLGMRAIYTGLITDYVGEKWKSNFWGVENEIDTKIIESIKGLCMRNRPR